MLATSAASMAATTPATSTPVWQDNPYPSTYKPYPGEPTAIVGATVFDGTGGEIANGTVLLRDGKVVAVGDARLAVPDAIAASMAPASSSPPG